MRAARPAEHLVLYGTLMSAFDTLDELGVRERLRLVGACTLAGRLYDMGEWPSLALGGGIVHGELFEVLDARVFVTLDRYEECYEHDPARSRYRRETVALLEPALPAWVYVANEQLPAADLIASGSWYARVAHKRPR